MDKGTFVDRTETEKNNATLLLPPDGGPAISLPLLEFRPNKSGEEMRPFIVIGDRTDHGGMVIGSTMTTDTHGKRLARVGDQVTCPKKGHGTTVIVTGDPTMIVDGAPVARHGDKCACGATLISSQVVSRIGEGGCSGGHRAANNASGSSGLAAFSSAAEANSHDDDLEQFFVMLDEHGNPASGFSYRLDDRHSKLHEASIGLVGMTVTQPMGRELTATFWLPLGGQQ